jgi:hypothetical protein
VTVNNKKVSFIQYHTNGNWDVLLPNKSWLCLLVVDQINQNHFDEVVSKIITKDVAYVSVIGKECELANDLIDEELAFRDADIENHYLPEHQIITTWHRDFEEGMWFAFNSADNADVVINEVVVLDMTGADEAPRIKLFLDTI